MTTSRSKPIRIMLVDDHAMVRRGLATFLKVHSDMQLVGEADSRMSPPSGGGKNTPTDGCGLAIFFIK